MKKFFYLLIGVMLLTASCSNDSETDFFTEVAKNEQAMNDALNTKAKGTYKLGWIVNKTFADSATFSTELDPYYTVISHFPMEHLFRINKTKLNLSSVDRALFKYDKSSYWLMDLSFTGYSAENAYLWNNNVAPRTYFQYDGVEYACQIWINTNTTNMSGDQTAWMYQTALLYDVERDVWSGAAKADSLSIINMKTNDICRMEGPIYMVFQTEGKKQK